MEIEHMDNKELAGEIDLYEMKIEELKAELDNAEDYLADLVVEDNNRAV